MGNFRNTSPVASIIKRTIQFGLLGVLAVFPYAFHLVLDSWGGRMLGEGLLMRRGDAALYDIIDRLLHYVGGRALIFVYVFCWVFVIGAGMKMLYAAWRESAHSGRPLRSVLPGMLVRLAVVLGLAVGFSGFGLNAFYLYPEAGITLLMSSFGGPLGPVFLYFLPMAQLCAYLSAGGALLYLAVVSTDFSAFALRCAVVIGIASAAFGCLYVTARYLDLGKYLSDVPGVTDRQEPRTLVVLAEKPHEYTIDDCYNDCLVSELFCKRIVSSAANSDAALAYLRKRDNMTALRGGVYSLAALNCLRELDPAGALRIYKDALVVTGDITQGISAITRLVYSPATPEYHSLLVELSDESRFTASGRTALRFSKAYARFGEMDKARYWHDKGKSTVLKLDEEGVKYFTLTDRPPFNSGKIAGRLTMNGSPAGGVRVGLARSFVVGQLEAVMSSKMGRREVSPFIDLQTVIDGTSTDTDGKFSFGGLYEDSYLILLSLEGRPDARYKVAGSPGIVTLSPATPSVDAGIIRLDALRP